MDYMLDNSTKYDLEELYEYIEDRFSYDEVELMLYLICQSI